MPNPYLMGLEIRRRLADRLALPRWEPTLPTTPTAVSGIVFGANKVTPHIPLIQPRLTEHLPGINPSMPQTPRFTGRLPATLGVVTDRGNKLPGTVEKRIDRA